MKLDGILCVAVVDANSDMVLGSAGSGINIEVAAAVNTEIVRAKLKAIRTLGLNDKIEDILVTLALVISKFSLFFIYNFAKLRHLSIIHFMCYG